MKKKIIVIGSTGMAGHMISMYLKQYSYYNIIDIVFEEKEKDCGKYYNPLAYNSLVNDLKEVQPDIIIYAHRITINESNTDPSKAIYFNSFLPQYLSESFKETESKIIYLSTDCVFSGKKGGYTEISLPDGEDIYAKTKALGEINNSKDLTIRTSYIGPNILNKQEELFDWFLMQTGKINGYTKAYWNGITTLELAQGIDEFIKNNISGIYHLVSKNKISKFELLTIINKIWNKNDVTIFKFNNKFVDKSLIDTRQKFSVNNYQLMFQILRDWMLSNKNIYSKYF